MWLSNSPDINHTINLNTTSTQIEQKQGLWSSFNSAMENINSKLELDWLKLELPKTKEQKEKEVYDNIYQDEIFKWALENGLFKQWIKVNYISETLFSVFSNKTKNLSFFCNEKWETLIEVPYRFKNFVDKNNKFDNTSLHTFEKTWYFLDAENKTWNIFKIIWTDEKWDFILSDTPLNKNSIDYFNALKKVIQYSDTMEILLSLKHKWNIWKWNIDDYIRSNALNLKFLQLLKNKNLLETPDVFEYAIKNMNLTIQDIVTAKVQWDITEEEWREIYNILKKSKLKSLD